MDIKNLFLSSINITKIFDKKESLNFYILLVMMLMGAALETLSVGLIFPLLSIMVNPTESSNLESFFIFFDISILSVDTITLVIYVVLFFFSIYFFKNIFLSYLFWRQSKFIYNLHEEVNNMLGKQSNLSYDEVRTRYEHFRSRCLKDDKPSNSIENGCINAFYGKKSKCILQIVPKESKKKTFHMSPKCKIKKLYGGK